MGMAFTPKYCTIALKNKKNTKILLLGIGYLLGGF